MHKKLSSVFPGVKKAPKSLNIYRISSFRKKCRNQSHMNDTKINFQMGFYESKSGLHPENMDKNNN